jgi:flagellar FliJ protein
MLEQYRDEYAQKMRDATMQGITQLALRNYQDFLGRIEEAIQQQAQAVRNSEHSTAAGQAHWKEQNKRLKAIDTLSQRHDSRERYRENKQEQKLLDEFTARKYVTDEQAKQEQ